MYDLPSEDPEEPGLPDEYHEFQPPMLRQTFQPFNYDPEEVFVGRDLRMSYVMWQEQISPFVVVELLSPGTEDENLGRTVSQTGKPPTKWHNLAYLILTGDRNYSLRRQTMKEFGLTLEETRIMFSYQYHLVLADLEYETNLDKKSLKRGWLSKWKDSTELFLKSQIDKDTVTNISFHLLTDFDLFKKSVKELTVLKTNKLTLYLVLLELTLFEPYYSLGDNDEVFKDLRIYDEEKLKKS
ncbi:hypothetical protein [Funiculus sociatus]